MPLPRDPGFDPSKMIPQPLKADVTTHVRVELPPEALQLMRDVHDDRQGMGAAALWCLVLATAVVWRYVRGGRP